MNTKVDMHLDKLTSLSKAAEQLSKKDNGDVSLTWTLRFCLNEYVKFAIKVPFEVNVWEWKEELDIGESCGKCVEIADQREELRMLDGKDGKILDETDLPQYCENCCMTGVRHRTGLGDFIRSRAGVFFLLRSDVEYLTDFDIKKITCYKLYVENNDWDSGYMQVETASERQACHRQWTYDQSADLDDSDNEFNEFLKDLCDEESNEHGLIVKRKDIYVWREDFDNALAGDGYIERKERDSKIIRPQRAADLATFIYKSVLRYKNKHGGKIPTGQPNEKAMILLDFCESEGLCQVDNKVRGKGNWEIVSNRFTTTTWKAWKASVERVIPKNRQNKNDKTTH